MADSTITVSGNLTRDPELRFFPDGSPVVNVSVAVNYRYKSAAGEWVEEDPSYEDLVIRGQLAQNVASTLAKGMRVIVSGRPRKRRYDKDGQTRTASEIVVDDIGPSLKFATAAVERVPSTGVGQPAQRPAPAPQPAQASGSAAGSPPSAYGDEEPF